MATSLVCEDVLQWAATYEGPPFMAMLCDPPYHLTADTRGVTRYNNHCQDAWRSQKATSGFMGKSWDGGDVAFRPETWAALARHLLPGAFVMAFASSRGWHRLACAMEDAGLIIHPSIFNYRTGETLDIGMYGWTFASGFPKSTKIDTQVDAHGGVNIGWFGPWLKRWREERGIAQKELAQHFPSKSGAVTGCVANWELGFNMPTVEQYNRLVEVLRLPFASLAEAEREAIGQRTTGIGTGNGSCPIMGDGSRDLTAPATPLAQAWAGHRYGLQALKPALEPIIVAQVPYVGRPVDSITQTGAGALNIAGGRIGTSDRLQGSTVRSDIRNDSYAAGHRPNPGDIPDYVQHPNGRWPANLALTHLPACQRIGTRQVDSHNGVRGASTNIYGGGKGFTAATGEEVGYASPDGTETVQAWACADGCPVAAFDAQAGNVGGGHRPHRVVGAENGTSLFGRRQLGETYDESTSHASRFFHVSDWSLDVAEQLAHADPVRYCAKASRSEREAGLDDMPLGMRAEREGRNPHMNGHYRIEEGHITDGTADSRAARNPHPCIKPLSLIRWLATLLLPPAAYAPRRLLVPFCGTGSEIIGAVHAGWESVVGIEQDPASVHIAHKRIAWWTGYTPDASASQDQAAPSAAPPVTGTQLNLF